MPRNFINRKPPFHVGSRGFLIVPRAGFPAVGGTKSPTLKVGGEPTTSPTLRSGRSIRLSAEGHRRATVLPPEKPGLIGNVFLVYRDQSAGQNLFQIREWYFGAVYINFVIHNMLNLGRPQ